MGLAVTAYFYINNLIAGKTSKVISLLDASCSGGKIVAIVSNDGNTNISTSEFKVLLDGNPSGTVDYDPDGPIAPHTTVVITIDSVPTGQTHELYIISPSSSTKQTIIC